MRERERERDRERERENNVQSNFKRQKVGETHTCGESESEREKEVIFGIKQL